MKILLIVGGWSSEREVSLSAVPGLKSALEELGHSVTVFDLLSGFNDVVREAREHDFAFINLHGTPGEDGLVQSLLEYAGCPYLGAGPSGSFLALHKAASKQIFRDLGLPTADWEYLPQRPAEGWEPRLGYPLFVKSCMGGSSLRLGKVENREELDSILDDIFAHGEGALLEPALKGRDVTCAVAGNKALPPILIVPQMGSYFDFKSKYSEGGAKEICPAPISEAATRKMQEYTLRAVEALGLNGYGRADFILGDNDELHILEVNTIPGMTQASLVPKAAHAMGMTFPAFLQSLIDLGMSQHGKKQQS